MNLELGVIADDITGACDVAAGVSEAGMFAEVRLGVPDPSVRPEAPCVIVALKSRTAPPAQAIADSVASARALRDWRAEHLYQKYCSTFDSTDEGNIGPVADSLLEQVGPTAVSIGTPATPAAGRTMHRGHLFVGDRLLSESSLAHHPLTPMHDPDLVRVLGRQTPLPVGSIAIEDVRAGADAIRGRVTTLRAEGVRHFLVDAVEDSDLDSVATAVAGLEGVLLTGAAGLAQALARATSAGGAASAVPAPPPGRALILSGSGSARTRAQIAEFGGSAFLLRMEELTQDFEGVVARAAAFAAEDDLPLVSATAEPEAVVRAQERWGIDRSAELIEHALARVAAIAVERLGVRRILVAGGETSGAVAAALRLDRLLVRRVAAPGVPWMSGTDAEGRVLDVCFKSGNFGGESFFRDAWKEPS
jgi:uncharacterized protein YgbK (DUF1537 family)